MRINFKIISLLLLGGLIFTSCKKNVKVAAGDVPGVLEGSFIVAPQEYTVEKDAEGNSI